MDNGWGSVDRKNERIYRKMHHRLKRIVKDMKYTPDDFERGRLSAFEEILDDLKEVYLV